MTTLSKHLLITLFLFIAFSAFSQIADSASIKMLNQSRLTINKAGMLILGTWALSNLAYGGFSLRQAEGIQKHFHQMNMGWGAVNLLIAGFAYYNASTGLTNLSLYETVHEQYQIQKILLLNSGLDLAYITTGFFLREKSKNSSKRPEMLEGFGNSLILQGGFLMLFDISLYLAHHSHNDTLKLILENVQLSGNQIGIIFKF